MHKPTISITKIPIIHYLAKFQDIFAWKILDFQDRPKNYPKSACKFQLWGPISMWNDIIAPWCWVFLKTLGIYLHFDTGSMSIPFFIQSWESKEWRVFKKTVYLYFPVLRLKSAGTKIDFSPKGPISSFNWDQISQ